MRAYEASTNSLEERIEGLKESYETEALKREEALTSYKKKLFILESERMDFIEELESKKTERRWIDSDSIRKRIWKENETQDIEENCSQNTTIDL